MEYSIILYFIVNFIIEKFFYNLSKENLKSNYLLIFDISKFENNTTNNEKSLKVYTFIESLV